MKIKIKGIECYAYHGCLPEESVIGGQYRVDIVIDLNADRAILEDDLAGTADYVVVNRIVREQMAIRSKLIEHAAGRILKALHANLGGEMEIEVSVTKYNPPVTSQIGSATVILKQQFH